MRIALALVALLLLGNAGPVLAEVSSVTSREALAAALAVAGPGDVIQIAPGTYAGGLSARGLQGTPDQPITVTALDPENPPVLQGSGTGLHLVQCAHVIVRGLVIRGASGNGLNIDDGGDLEKPSHHLTLEDLEILEIGPEGNRDAIKLSGVNHFLVRDCRIRAWGGSAIDMVGCHQGVIESCSFEGQAGFSQSNAVQMKGGSSDLLVHKNRFDDVGHRAINIGGHTGAPYFRPRDPSYEATRIEVAGNTFEGSVAPIAWATARGGWVHHNTILRPQKWVLRILQENGDEKFVPSGGGRFEHNVIVCDDRVSTAVNVGGGTAPETFSFADNAWFLRGGRAPELPVTEAGSELGMPAEAGAALEEILARQTAKGRGADAYREGVLFTCDFESPEWFRQWDEETVPDHLDTVLEDEARRFEPHRGRALRVRVPAGGHLGANLRFDFAKRTGSEPEAVCFRYALRFANDWLPEQGGKLPGIAGTYGRAGWGGRPVDGTDGWSARGLFLGLEDGKTPVGFYCYHADMRGKYGAHWVWDREERGFLENNRWYRIEQDVRMNTPGKNDGVLRAWVDGELAFEKTDVRFRDVDTLKIETVWLNVYYGGTWAAPRDYHLYIDEVVISRHRLENAELP